jgi:hypothetical protein
MTSSPRTDSSMTNNCALPGNAFRPHCAPVRPSPTNLTMPIQEMRLYMLIQVSMRVHPPRGHGFNLSGTSPGRARSEVDSGRWRSCVGDEKENFCCHPASLFKPSFRRDRRPDFAHPFFSLLRSRYSDTFDKSAEHRTHRIRELGEWEKSTNSGHRRMLEFSRDEETCMDAAIADRSIPGAPGERASGRR